jgi:hypothetical protein
VCRRGRSRSASRFLRRTPSGISTAERSSRTWPLEPFEGGLGLSGPRLAASRCRLLAPLTDQHLHLFERVPGGRLIHDCPLSTYFLAYRSARLRHHRQWSSSQPARGHVRRFVEMALAVSDHDDQEDHQLELGRSELDRAGSARCSLPRTPERSAHRTWRLDPDDNGGRAGSACR